MEERGNYQSFLHSLSHIQYSSFTKQVIDNRREGDASRVRNVVEHFG